MFDILSKRLKTHNQTCDERRTVPSSYVRERRGDGGLQNARDRHLRRCCCRVAIVWDYLVYDKQARSGRCRVTEATEDLQSVCVGPIMKDVLQEEYGCVFDGLFVEEVVR